MSDIPFLILHKVRGLPAFDIANCCDDMGTEDDPAPWWIIPTSGHRAHPYSTCDLYSISLESFLSLPKLLEVDSPQWVALLDHYHTTLPASPSRLSSLLSLIRKPIKRRTL